MHGGVQVSQNLHPPSPGDPPHLLTLISGPMSSGLSPPVPDIYINTFLMFWTPLNHSIFHGMSFSPSPLPDPFPDSPIPILEPPNFLQTLLGGIWRIFRRVYDDWKGWKFVVSRTTPCDLTPSPWLFCLPYRRPTSRSGPTSHIHHLCRALDGV